MATSVTRETDGNVGGFLEITPYCIQCSAYVVGQVVVRDGSDNFEVLIAAARYSRNLNFSGRENLEETMSLFGSLLGDFEDDPFFG